jgi:hypothetical protein
MSNDPVNRHLQEFAIVVIVMAVLCFAIVGGLA